MVNRETAGERYEAAVAGLPLETQQFDRPCWVLVIAGDTFQATMLEDSLAESANSLAILSLVDGRAAELAELQLPSKPDGSMATRPGRRPADVVIAPLEAKSWRTITLLSALRHRLELGEVTVLLITDIADELLPVHLTDFPGIRRLCPDEDIARAVTSSLRIERAAP